MWKVGYIKQLKFGCVIFRSPLFHLEPFQRPFSEFFYLKACEEK